MFEEIFQYKKFNTAALQAYGFQRDGENYKYQTEIFDGEFLLNVTVGKIGLPMTSLTEKSTGAEYVLYKTDAVGAFVGRVRAAVTEVLSDIAAHCCETAIFSGIQTIKLITYVREKYGDQPEHLWKESPQNAIFRRKDFRKWYGVLMTVSRRKFGMDSEKTVEILDLKMPPEKLKNLVDYKRYYPGWHMNKKHWYTVILDGSVPFEEICRRIDESYSSVK